jgi:hypothetical protein
MNLANAVQQTTQAVNAAPNVDAIYSKIGALSTAPASRSVIQAFAALETTKTPVDKGKAVFARFEPYLKKAICADLKYCTNKASVSGDIQKVLQAIDKHLPFTAALPGWLATILGWVGVAATSWEALVVLLAAAAIKEGFDALCGC